MSESNIDEDSGPSEIDDPESYVDHRRLKTIFDIRDSLHEQRSRIKMASYEPDIHRGEALSAYRALISSYVVEIEPIFHRFDGGDTILNHTDFGQTVVKPKFVKKFNPDNQRTQKMLDISNNSDYPDKNVASVDRTAMVPDYTQQELENTGPLEIHPANREAELETVFEHKGLLSLIQNPDPLVGKWEIPVMIGSESRSTPITHTSHVQIGFRTLDNMMRTANNFLAEIGFEVNPNEEQDNLHLSLE